MSVTPGYILTDEYGECIGLTLPEVACVVAEADHGMDPKVGKVRVIGPITPLVMLWTPTRKPRLRVQRGEGGEGVYPDAADIAEMRQVLAGQVAP